MTDVLDAITQSIVLSMLPWMIVQMGGGAALCYRLDVSPWIGLAGGLIPLPFAGWALVATVAWGRRNQVVERVRKASEQERRW